MTIVECPKPPIAAINQLFRAHANDLSATMEAQRQKLFPPKATKSLRRFTSVEAAKIIGVTDSYLRRLSLDQKGPVVEVSTSGRRYYTLDDIQALRVYLDSISKGDTRYLPNRRDNEHLQVLVVTNLKGGSAKTTTSIHLCQFLSLRGYRVLAIDLDPQASLTAMFGLQPEIDVHDNETLYGAVRYDSHRKSLKAIIRKTYFTNLDLVPGQLELMEFEHETAKTLGSKHPERLFFTRIDNALREVADDYDVVVIDCQPSIGFLTMSALCAATAVLITVHPQMLDLMSMNQFLLMTSDLLDVIARFGGNTQVDWMGYLITRYEPGDSPQNQMLTFMRSLFGDHVLNYPMVKSTAISDAGLSKQTLYELSRDNMTRATYDRAMEALNNVNSEIEGLIAKAWGRR